jgi:hypothetical protein
MQQRRNLLPPPATGSQRSTQPPTELGAVARRRLERLSLLLTGVFGAMVALALALTAFGGEERVSPVDAVLTALCAALFLALRSPKLSDDASAAIGLCFMIAVVGLIQVGNINGVWHAHGHVPSANFGCVLIVAMPLIVPTRPVRVIVAAGLAAATAPLGVLILQGGAGAELAARDYLHVRVVPVVAAVLVVAGSRLVHGLGVEVSRARKLGAYQLIERIGAGGMGEVWRAEHDMLARADAIKLIRGDADRADDTRMRRFEREAQVTAKLRSPHTVELYDFGILDFGLVGLRSSPAAKPDDALTADHVVQGTPAYMAPESVVSPDRAGPASDLYALGCVGYWLLAGRTLFDLRGAVAQLTDAVHTAAVSLADRGVELPPALDALILRCLAKQPEQRPASASALRRDLLALATDDWSDERARACWASRSVPPGGDAGAFSVTALDHIAAPDVRKHDR